jgi:protocatechuate 3,4-dioxygenase beta subunit
MDNDDKQIGRILNRREALALLGVAGAGVVASRLFAQNRMSRVDHPASLAWMPACVVTPAQMEGPYFVDEKLNRVDIRSDPETGKVSVGSQLDVEMRVYSIADGKCTPMPGAMVDLWQCDAMGVYSDVRDTNGFFSTVGQKFLRGYQVTDGSGVARFTTLYPGWYQGRTVHLHFKVRSTSGGRNLEFTSQLYFDDAFTDKVMAKAPYNTKTGTRVTNDRDRIFQQQGGRQLLMPVEERAGVYKGTFDIGMAV